MSNRCAWNYVLTPVRGHQCIFSFCFLGKTHYSDSLQFVRVCWQRSPPGLFHLPWAPWYPTRYRGFEDPFRSGLSRGLQFRKWHSDSDGPPSAPKDTPADPPFSGLWPLPLRLVCLGYPRAPKPPPPTPRSNAAVCLRPSPASSVIGRGQSGLTTAAPASHPVSPTATALCGQTVRFPPPLTPLGLVPRRRGLTATPRA